MDKSQYRRFAARVCGYGFVVVVPNFPAVFDLGLFADTAIAEGLLAYLEAESARADSVLAGRVRVDRLAFFGHSFGGVGALHAARAEEFRGSLDETHFFQVFTFSGSDP